MKKMLLVAYEVEKPRPELIKAIKKRTGYWWHYVGIWLVYTDDTPKELSQHLRQFIEDDNLFVVKINKNYQGWLPESAWNWLNEKDF